MKISAKLEYACLAILELARNSKPDSPLRLKIIAAKHKIPEAFLVQILFKLRRAGIVAAVRGSIGGYYLIPKPEEITLGFICSLIDDLDSKSTALSQNNSSQNSLNYRSQKFERRSNSQSEAQFLLEQLFDQAEQRRLEFLNSITFNELLNYSSSEDVF